MIIIYNIFSNIYYNLLDIYILRPLKYLQNISVYIFQIFCAVWKCFFCQNWNFYMKQLCFRFRWILLIVTFTFYIVEYYHWSHFILPCWQSVYSFAAGTSILKLIKFGFTRFLHLGVIKWSTKSAGRRGWNMIVVARATPSLSYFLECIIIIASCMRSVAASSFRRWHATSRTRTAKIDISNRPADRCASRRLSDSTWVRSSTFSCESRRW